MVFCGIYPADGANYPDLQDALEKLQLNDACLTFEPETRPSRWASASAAASWACSTWRSFSERLEREFDLDLITTLAERHLPR